ncbi:MAG TPA: hypothetical protein VGC86_17705 [Afipia sp.]
MTALAIGTAFLGTLIVIVVCSWWSVLRDIRSGEPSCPRCRGRMTLVRALDRHLTLQCKRCGRGEPSWSSKARAWAKSRLHPPC